MSFMRSLVFEWKDDVGNMDMIIELLKNDDAERDITIDMPSLFLPHLSSLLAYEIDNFAHYFRSHQKLMR